MWTFLLSAILLGGASARILAPLKEPKDHRRVIPGRYIVRLKSDLGVRGGSGAQPSVMVAMAMHQAWLTDMVAADPASTMHHFFDVTGLKGYAGEFSEMLLAAIRGRDEVDFVEPDQIMHIVDEQFLAIDPQSVMDWRELLRGVGGMNEPRAVISQGFRSKQPIDKSGTEEIQKQRNAPWGLQRISNKGPLPSKGTAFYKYPKKAGAGVDVYVIDTGINIKHLDFEGRAFWGKTIPMFDEDIDGNGHGTHCAGTIAGKRFGVAKKARLYAVKVLMTSGFGTNADVIKGVEWTIKQHFIRSRHGRRSVANMSLGGGKSETLEDIVNLAVRLGVHFAVAAGNDNEDACDYSPAAATGPVTVGAMDRFDKMAWFSNVGSCVDLFAPGVNITSAWIGSPYSVNTISGTSMASPHVAGILALHLGERSYTPKALKRLLVEQSSRDLLSGIPEESQTSNLLVNIEHLLKA